MKKLLALALLSLALPLAAKAQLVTNVTFKITVDVINTGVSTNSINTTLKFDSSGKNDALRVQGWIFAYQAYTNSIGTNTPVAFEALIKQRLKDISDNYANQVQATLNAARLDALKLLLTVNSDKLANSDYNALDAVIAKGQ